MDRGDKSGLSTVIVTLILIGLALVAITLIWVVIRNILDTGANQITLDKFTINLDVQKVTSTINGIDIIVKRPAGKGEIQGLKFIISDGVQDQGFEIKNISLNELDEKTYSIPYTGLVKKVSVAPIIKEGQNSAVGDIKDTLEIESKQAIKNMQGLVSWWRFEGNANDEMRINNGAVSGATPTAGKFGQGYNFKITANKITVADNSSLRLENSNMTIIAWINITISATSIYSIFSKQPLFNEGYLLKISKDDQTNDTTYNFQIGNNPPVVGINALPKNKWIHIVGSQNIISGSRKNKIYLDGNLDQELPTSSLSASTSGYNFIIGNDGVFGNTAFRGAIDEVMIFNRSLSDNEIKAIYQLDLS